LLFLYLFYGENFKLLVEAFAIYNNKLKKKENKLKGLFIE